MNIMSYKEIEELYEQWWNEDRYKQYHEKYGDVIILFQLVNENPLEFKVVKIGDLSDSSELFNFALQNNYIQQCCDNIFCYQTIKTPWKYI